MPSIQHSTQNIQELKKRQKDSPCWVGKSLSIATEVLPLLGLRQLLPLFHCLQLGHQLVRNERLPRGAGSEGVTQAALFHPAEK